MLSSGRDPSLNAHGLLDPLCRFVLLLFGFPSNQFLGNGCYCSCLIAGNGNILPNRRVLLLCCVDILVPVSTAYNSFGGILRTQNVRSFCVEGSVKPQTGRSIVLHASTAAMDSICLILLFLFHSTSFSPVLSSCKVDVVKRSELDLYLCSESVSFGFRLHIFLDSFALLIITAMADWALKTNLFLSLLHPVINFLKKKNVLNKPVIYYLD